MISGSDCGGMARGSKASRELEPFAREELEQVGPRAAVAIVEVDYCILFSRKIMR